eukprot:g2192.t1
MPGGGPQQHSLTVSERKQRYMRLPPSSKRVLDLHVMNLIGFWENSRVTRCHQALTRLRLARNEDSETFSRARFTRVLRRMFLLNFVLVQYSWSSWVDLLERRRCTRRRLQAMCDALWRGQMRRAFRPWAARKRAIAACTVISRVILLENTGVGDAWRRWRRWSHRFRFVGLALAAVAEDAEAGVAAAAARACAGARTAADTDALDDDDNAGVDFGLRWRE